VIPEIDYLVRWKVTAITGSTGNSITFFTRGLARRYA
jgi:hypothetical protein